MAHDFDPHAHPSVEAPGAWTDGMVQAALDSGVSADTSSGISVSRRDAPWRLGHGLNACAYFGAPAEGGPCFT